MLLLLICIASAVSMAISMAACRAAAAADSRESRFIAIRRGENRRLRAGRQAKRRSNVAPAACLPVFLVDEKAGNVLSIGGPPSG
jgi:hypothetical protein